MTAEAAVETQLPSRRERRRIEIRDRIVAAARSLFEQQGFEATPVSEICRRADIAYGTFFNHFPSKRDLLHELSDVALRDLFERVEELGDEPGSFGDHLVRLFEDAAERAETMGSKPRELMREIVMLSFPDPANTEGRRVRMAFDAFLSRGRESGDLRTDVDLETQVDVVVGTWYSIFLSWTHFEDYPLRKRASAAAHFLAGTLTVSGNGSALRSVSD